MDIQIEKGVSNAPPRILVYGHDKMGKTTFASKAPKPLFIRTEDGTGSLNVDKLPVIETFQDFLDQCKYLATNPNHGYETFVFDNITFFENIVHNQVIKDKPKTEKGKVVKDITDYGFGNGYKMAFPYWVKFFEAFDWFRENQNVMTIFIGHATSERYDNPLGEPYDRVVLDLKDTYAALANRSVDNIFFISAKDGIVKTDVGFGKEVKRGVSLGQRVIHTERTAAFDAGHRYPGLPKEIPFTPDGGEAWSILLENIPYLSNKYKLQSTIEGE